MKKKLLKQGYLVLLLLGITLTFVNCSSDNRLQKQLEKYVEEQNPTYPIYLDKATELRSCEALPHKTLRYNYRLAMPKLGLDTTVIKSKLRTNVLSLLKVDKGTAYLRDNDVVFKYRFIDNEDQYAFQLVLTKEDYKK